VGESRPISAPFFLLSIFTKDTWSDSTGKSVNHVYADIDYTTGVVMRSWFENDPNFSGCMWVESR
jgi:hypothetical protein